MLKILAVFFCIFVVTRGIIKPDKLSYEGTASRWQHRHLLNMTENLVKDAMYKIRHADLVQSGYKHTHGYELGLIASGIMEKYRHMIVIYRYYSNAKDFKSMSHTFVNIINAYAVMQSDYNEMLHETVLFYEILDFHMRIQNAEKLRARKLARKHKMSETLILQMIRAGIDVESILEAPNKPGLGVRRQMPVKGDYSTWLDPDSMEQVPFSSTMSSIVEEMAKWEGYELPKENEWVKKSGNNTKEADYKKSLRYKTWADKWGGFNPDVEGVKIPDKLAKMGIKNASDFILNELKDDFI